MNEVIDVNVSLGNWPFQELEPSTAEELQAHLEQEQIDEAWVSCADSILFPDPDVHDARLFEALKPIPSLHPVKTLNPMLANWEQSLRRAVEDWGARAVKVYMNYHQLSSKDYRMCQFMERFVGYGLPLLMQIRIEDERNQCALMPVAGVDTGQITMLSSYFPDATLVALGAQQGEISSLARANNVYADISWTDGVDAVWQVLEKMPAERVLFGSHTPFFYTRSARMKLERAEIDPQQKRAIAATNAQRLFAASPV